MNARWVSPLRYPGGKVRMTPWLAEQFWAQLGPMDIELWIEPFAGGAGAALMAVAAHDVPEAWLIERNPALAAFWRAVIHANSELAGRVHELTPTMDTYEHSREIVAQAMEGTASDDLDLALAAFVVNRCTRSGIVHPRSGVIGGKHQSGRWSLTSRFNGPSLAERIRGVGAISSRLRIIEGDGIDVIGDLPGSGVENEVFVFADPPYVGVGNDLYAHGMDTEAHARLASVLQGTSCPWALTYDAHPAVLELYPAHRILEFQASHTANRQKVGTEYLVLSPTFALSSEEHPLGKGDHWWIHGAEQLPAPA